jgi:uncharacterized protein DUF1996
MRRTVLLRMPRKRMMLTLFAALLAFSAASVVTFVASLTKAPAASAQTIQNPDHSYFIARCDFSHRSYDDPIVYPDQPGAAHRHDFFGNKSTNYQSTYNKLLAANTTCLRSGDKSAYWIPTVKWNGQTLKADRGLFYYGAGNKDPAKVKAPPAGLKVVADTHATWRCQTDAAFTEVPPTQCPDGQLNVHIDFPDCSDGRRDSADHRKHMAYSVRPSDGGPNQCPDAHPTPVPMLTVSIRFPIPTTAGTVTLSSGAASTMHSDFFNAWSQETLERLVMNCINEYSPTTREWPTQCQQPLN